MVFPQHRCIHVHIPKTAGQSVREFLAPGLPNSIAFTAPSQDAGPNGTHLTAKEMQAHDPFGWWPSCFSFAIVRNPWDRALSEYRWRQRRKHARVSFDSFEVFLRAALDGWEFQRDDARHLMLQRDFVLSENSGCLVDFLGRYETLEADLDQVAQRLGLPRREVPLLNSSRASSSESMAGYTPTTRQMVTELWGGDIEYFGYEFNFSMVSMAASQASEPDPSSGGVLPQATDDPDDSASLPHGLVTPQTAPSKAEEGLEDRVEDATRRIAKLESQLQKLTEENRALRQKLAEIQGSMARSVSKRLRSWFRRRRSSAS